MKAKKQNPFFSLTLYNQKVPVLQIPKYFQASSQFRKINIDDNLFVEYCNYQKSTKNRLKVNENLIIFVLDGTKKVYTPERVYSVNKNEALFIRKGSYLMSEIPKGKKYESILFFLNENLIKDFIYKNPDVFKKVTASQSEIRYAYPIKVTDLLLGFYTSIIPYFSQKDQARIKPLLKLKFSELLLSLAFEKDNRELLGFIYGLLEHPKIDIEKVMQENFRHNLSLAEFATICGRSVSTFKRDFERKFQTTPGKWLLAKRLEHAKFLLNTTDRSVSEIAYDCGFEDPSHFTKSFKKKFGVAPTALKAELSRL